MNFFLNCSFKRRVYDWQAHGPISVAGAERVGRILLPYSGESGDSQHKRAVHHHQHHHHHTGPAKINRGRASKPHRPLTAHQHGRKGIRSAGNGRDSGVVLEREVLAPAQRNLGWLEKYRWVNLSTSRGSVSSVSFSILHVYDPAGLWEVRPVSHLHHHHHHHHQHHHHHHCWRCCAQGFILSWWWWWDCFVLLHIVTESLYELGQWQELNMARLLE